MNNIQATRISTEDPFLALRSLPPFRLFSSEELREVVPLTTIEYFPKGVTVVGEGEASNNRVYFLLSGGVDVFVSGRFILGLRRAGDIFGEMSLISDEDRSATVKTIEPCYILAINSALTFNPGEENYYKFRYLFSRMFNAILTHKLRMTSERARLYEDAMQESEQAKAQTNTLQGQIRDNMLQIRIYSHLVDSAKEVIMIASTEGIVLEANRALTTEFGLDPRAVEGEPFGEFLRLPDGSPWPAQEVFSQRTGSGWSGEVEVLASHTNGGSIPADCTISLVQDSDNNLLAYAAILRNIQERKTYEKQILEQSKELQKANDELVELDQMKDNFIGLISHELRTPLTSIIAYSEMLSMEGMVEPEDQKEFLSTIHKEANELNELVNKIITISKIESGQIMLEFVPGKLTEVVDEQAAMFRGKAEQKGLTLTTKLLQNEREMRFDGSKIREMLRQLIENAIEYTSEGGVVLEVQQTENETLIQVQDTGKGMEEYELDNAFNRFAQIKNIKYHQSGIGLGLPLAFMISQAHGGEIVLQSEVGQGTVVTVHLPLAGNENDL